MVHTLWKTWGLPWVPMHRFACSAAYKWGDQEAVIHVKAAEIQAVVANDRIPHTSYMELGCVNVELGYYR